MDKLVFRHLSTPQLEKPVFVCGLPGYGNIGKITSRLLIQFSEAKPFAELYSPSFPDYVSVNSHGICRLPRYDFYSAKMNKDHFIILTGDAQPSLDDVVPHYDLCDQILDFMEKYKCKLVITIGGVPIPNPNKEVYVAATSPELASEIMEKGAIIYGRGKIMGAAGLFLGLAKARGRQGACLLGATRGTKPDRESALSVFKFLMKILKTDAKEGL